MDGVRSVQFEGDRGAGQASEFGGNGVRTRLDNLPVSWTAGCRSAAQPRDAVAQLLTGLQSLHVLLVRNEAAVVTGPQPAAVAVRDRDFPKRTTDVPDTGLLSDIDHNHAELRVLPHRIAGLIDRRGQRDR